MKRPAGKAPGGFLFWFAGHPDPVSDRIKNKIGRLELQVTRLEQQGRV